MTAQAAVAAFEPFLTAEEASRELRKLGLRFEPTTLGDKARAHKLPSAKINGRRLFRLSQILAAIEAQGHQG